MIAGDAVDANIQRIPHEIGGSMAKVFDEIDEKLRAWIERQHLFFVATAPSGDEGHVNVSPKGPIGSLRILDPLTVEYDDHIGSGAETTAHLRENGRICLMFCAFDGPPRIVRLHGRGEIVPAPEPVGAGVRGVIRVAIDRVSDACGYGVPLMEHIAERPQREAWLAKHDEDSLRAYMERKNSTSIDGLPAFTP
jgi:predicted pyridoxine 5'-phosphate oxidase superfamily flavin-nucleotide-binding protein